MSVSLPLSPSRTGFSWRTAKLSIELPGLRLHAKPAQRPANKTKAHMLPKIQCLLKLGVEVGNEPNGPGSAVEPCKVYELQAFFRYTGNAVFAILTEGLAVRGKISIIPGYAKHALQATLQKELIWIKSGLRCKMVQLDNGFLSNFYPRLNCWEQLSPCLKKKLPTHAKKSGKQRHYGVDL